MNREHIERYQAESVKRANMPPIAKHGQNKQARQSERASA
ncbi:hypothetical protein [uncultured Enterobacter sp.]|nr:hypothetical protein [uncultured Enterobacter sp.]